MSLSILKDKRLLIYMSYVVTVSIIIRHILNKILSRKVFLVRSSLMILQGVIEAYSTLNCEILYFPSFSSSASGRFYLDVAEGNTETLQCKAKFAA